MFQHQCDRLWVGIVARRFVQKMPLRQAIDRFDWICEVVLHVSCQIVRHFQKILQATFQAENQDVFLSQDLFGSLRSFIETGCLFQVSFFGTESTQIRRTTNVHCATSYSLPAVVGQLIVDIEQHRLERFHTWRTVMEQSFDSEALGLHSDLFKRHLAWSNKNHATYSYERTIDL